MDTPKTDIKSDKVARLIEAFNMNVDMKGKRVLSREAKNCEDNSDGETEYKATVLL